MAILATDYQRESAILADGVLRKLYGGELATLFGARLGDLAGLMNDCIDPFMHMEVTIRMQQIWMKIGRTRAAAVRDGTSMAAWEIENLLCVKTRIDALQEDGRDDVFKIFGENTSIDGRKVMDDRLTLEQLLAMLHGAMPEGVQALVLTGFHELTIERTAQCMGLSVQNVKTILKRAKVFLTKLL